MLLLPAVEMLEISLSLSHTCSLAYKPVQEPPAIIHAKDMNVVHS